MRKDRLGLEILALATALSGCQSKVTVVGARIGQSDAASEPAVATRGTQLDAMSIEAPDGVVVNLSAGTAATVAGDASPLTAPVRIQLQAGDPVAALAAT